MGQLFLNSVKMPTDCPTCGDTFDSQRGMRIHHSKIHGESISGFNKTCEQCGEEFTGRNRKNKYCSKNCQHKSLIVDKWQTCENCEKQFEGNDNRKFCSLKCSGESQRDRTITVCGNCDKKFEHCSGRNAKYCSNHCRLYARWGDYEPGPTTRKSPRWRYFSKKYRAWVGECESCGSCEKLHVHHDEPIFKGGELWNNTFTVLCKNCHIGNFSKWH